MNGRAISFISRIAVFSAIFLFVAPLFGEDNPEALFERAIALKSAEIGPPDASMQTGNRVDGNESTALFAEAARLFETQTSSDWRAWYEAGNARWWAGEPALAVRNYRRFLAHDPFRGEAWENLAEARKSSGTEAPGREGFLSWPWFLWFASAAAFLAGLSALALGLFFFFRAQNWKRVAVILVVAGIGFGLASAGTFAARRPLGIVIAATQGRKGDSSVYAPSPARPWKKGQEVWIVEIRDTWTKVLVGNTVSWIPSDSVERIEK